MEISKVLMLLADPEIQRHLTRARALIWLIENGAAAVYVSAHKLTESIPTVIIQVTFADGTQTVGRGDGMLAAAKNLMDNAKEGLLA